MHESVMKFIDQAVYPQEIYKKDILEVGALDVNGSIRPLIERYRPHSYLGIDLVKGQGVDLVSDVRRVPKEMRGHTVFSCEMLEHAEDWVGALIATADLACETLFLTCRSPGFPYHSPPDCWRFMPDDIERAAVALGFHVCVCMPDPQVPGVFLKAVRAGFINVQNAPSPLN